MNNIDLKIKIYYCDYDQKLIFLNFYINFLWSAWPSYVNTPPISSPSLSIVSSVSICQFWFKVNFLKLRFGSEFVGSSNNEFRNKNIAVSLKFSLKPVIDYKSLLIVNFTCQIPPLFHHFCESYQTCDYLDFL